MDRQSVGGGKAEPGRLMECEGCVETRGGRLPFFASVKSILDDRKWMAGGSRFLASRKGGNQKCIAKGRSARRDDISWLRVD